MYSEKATKFCEIFPLLLTACTVVKSKGKILQNFVAFSEHMNFKGYKNWKLDFIVVVYSIELFGELLHGKFLFLFLI